MAANKYNNFVKASTSESAEARNYQFPSLSGDEAKRIYLEEIKDVKPGQVQKVYDGNHILPYSVEKRESKVKIEPSNKDLFLAAEHNDVLTLKRALQDSPQKVDMLDDYGWSLLMIACQANSVETVKELLHHGADTSVRDKAGNSAQNLVIKSKNMQIVELLLNNLAKEDKPKPKTNNSRRRTVEDDFICETCKSTFPNKMQHITSTLHNINASKGKKLPTGYKIPESNRGYQIMLRGGWDKDNGLGSEGTGIKYPIKPVQKKDRKGLGHEKIKKTQEDSPKITNRKVLNQEYHRNRQKEINFRREFY